MSREKNKIGRGNRNKRYGTRDSEVIPDLRTDRAWRRLACKFEMGLRAGDCTLAVSESFSISPPTPTSTSCASKLNNIFRFRFSFHYYSSTFLLSHHPIPLFSVHSLSIPCSRLSICSLFRLIKFWSNIVFLPSASLASTSLSSFVFS